MNRNMQTCSEVGRVIARYVAGEVQSASDRQMLCMSSPCIVRKRVTALHVVDFVVVVIGNDNLSEMRHIGYSHCQYGNISNLYAFANTLGTGADC
jgi:hypothetical protein